MKEINVYKSKDSTSNIRLDSNESFMNLSEEKQKDIKELISKIEFNRYPDDIYLNVRKLYAKYAGDNLSEENVIVGHGSDEMLNLIISSVISAGKKFYTLSPDFSMYDYYVSLYGGEVVKYIAEEDGSIDIDKFIEKGQKENVDLIIFSNPNNPTGHVLSTENIIKILESFKDIKVVVDEAYYEFYGETMVNLIDQYNNLIVTRTLSKAWGLAALRVGFLLSNKECVKELLSYKVPFNVNTLSQLIAEKVLEDKNSINEQIELIKIKREVLYRNLKDLEKAAQGKVKFYDSKANFIFGRTEEKEKLFDELNQNNISIRNFNDNSFRISVGNDDENKKILQVLKKVFL
ncbi:MAG: histidinol-phosphate transaminase [Clostridiaceae bacterium]|nr:histidinol-phosphate transaminase [Clostridiaceae bacterium]